MKYKVESCTKETRLTKGGVMHTGIKINGAWYNIAGDHRGLYGKEVDLEIQGSWAKLIEATGPAGQPSANGDGSAKIDWEDYVAAVREAHLVANELEPDENQTVEGHINRSQARSALVNTMMIALVDGRITLPPSGEPPAKDDDSPF